MALAGKEIQEALPNFGTCKFHFNRHLVLQPPYIMDKHVLNVVKLLRHGSNERDSSHPVMLSAAKHLAADRDRPFASLRVTRYDCSNGQRLFFTIEPCFRI